MAAPAKNYSDPTTLSKWSLGIPAPSTSALPFLRQPSAWLPVTGHMGDMPMIAVASASAQINTSGVRVPNPPVGRMLIATFPSIYRDRDSALSRKSLVGQVWPLITTGS